MASDARARCVAAATSSKSNTSVHGFVVCPRASQPEACSVQKDYVSWVEYYLYYRSSSTQTMQPTEYGNRRPRMKSAKQSPNHLQIHNNNAHDTCAAAVPSSFLAQSCLFFVLVLYYYCCNDCGLLQSANPNTEYCCNSNMIDSRQQYSLWNGK